MWHFRELLAGSNGYLGQNELTVHVGVNQARVADAIVVCGSDQDGNIGIVDLLALLGQWGGAGACDFDGGGVGITDFLELLSQWGPCP